MPVEQKRRRASIDTRQSSLEPQLSGLPPSPLEALSPTARRILRAARRLVAKGGYDALSMQAVAQASGELKSTVAYQFGSKAGLVRALVEWLTHDTSEQALAARFEQDCSTEERAKTLLQMHRETVANTEYWRLFLGLLPGIVADKRMRAQFEELLHWYFERNLRVLGLWRGEESRQEFEPLASLLLAILEGFAFQNLLLADYDLDRRYELVETLLTPCILKLVASQPRATDG